MNDVPIVCPPANTPTPTPTEPCITNSAEEYTENQLNLVVIQDACVAGICSPADDDSFLILDRCLIDSSGNMLKRFKLMQPDDRKVTLPPTIDSIKTPIFKGERLISSVYAAASQTNSAIMSVRFRDLAGTEIWILKHYQGSAGLDLQKSIIPNIPDIQIQPVAGKPGKTYIIVPLDRDGTIEIVANQTVHQYEQLFIAHIFNPQGVAGAKTNECIPSNKLSVERINEISNRMPACRQRVNDALTGTATWSNLP